MDIASLQAFLAVGREGHVTRASRVLHVTQPAVSARLSKLEDELGQSLFHRTPKGMALTDAGQLLTVYVETALRILADGRTALEELAGLERGSLSIGGGATAITYLLPSLLGAFHQDHQGIRIFVREQGSRGVIEAVLRGDLDLGVVTLEPTDTPGRGLGAVGDIRHEKLSVQDWVDDELRLIVPPGHPLEGRKSFRWSDLEGEKLVLFEAEAAVRRLIDQRLEASGTAVEIVMELRSIESIKQMVATGIGAAFVSRFALSSADAGLRCADGALTRTLAVITRADRNPNAATAAFRERMFTSPDLPGQ